MRRHRVSSDTIKRLFAGPIDAESVAPQLIHVDSTQDLLLRLDDGSFITPDTDLDWIYEGSRQNIHGEPRVFVSPFQHPAILRKRARFALAKDDAVVQQILEPLIATLGDSVNSFVSWPDQPLRSAAHLMMRIVFAPLDGAADGDVATAYRRGAEIATLSQLPWSTATRDRYCTLLLERLCADEHATPPSSTRSPRSSCTAGRSAPTWSAASSPHRAATRITTAA